MLKYAVTMLACALVGAVPVAHAEDPPVTGFLNKSVGDHRYVLYVPAEYVPTKVWPLIVFLHGAGERGEDGLKQSDVGIGRAIRMNPERFPAIVLMPQCPEDRYWDAAILHGIVERAMEKTRHDYAIDDTRVYLTGLSMGGYGTWMWGAVKSDRFAALMPICGGGDVEDLNSLAKKSNLEGFGTLEERVQRLAQVPIYAFHGEDDEVVPPIRSQQMVKLVKDAGGDVKYKEFPETGHNSWDAAYGSANAIKWLFKQEKK